MASTSRLKPLALVLAAGGLAVLGYHLRAENLAEMSFEDRPATVRFDAEGDRVVLHSEVAIIMAHGEREEDLPRIAFDVMINPEDEREAISLTCDATPGEPTFIEVEREGETAEQATWNRILDDCPLQLSPGTHDLTVTPRWTHRGREGDVLVGCELVVVAD